MKKNDSAASQKNSASLAVSLPIAGYGLGKTGFTPDNGDLVDETVDLAAAAEILDDAMQAGLSVSSGRTSAGPQYLLSVPVL